MTQWFRQRTAVIAGLVMILGVAWAGQALTIPEVSGSATGSQAASAPTSTKGTATDFVAVAKAITPAVVNITRIAEARPSAGRDSRERFRDREEWEEWMEKFHDSPWSPPRPRGPHGPDRPWGPPGGGMGSGVIVSPDGYIVTNHHVVQGAREVTVTLPDKREFTGTIVGTDPKADLAVVKIEARDLRYVPWGNSGKLQVGEPVLAVGNPFGLTSTVTQGIISAMGRGGMGITQYEDFIQTDAAINPGNSGGALVNRKGELVGINTAIYSRTGGYQGVGFAVPTSMAKPVYESLVKTGKVVRGYLGIGIQELTQDLAESFVLNEPKGALVGDVKAKSPADEGGLKRGDVIVRYQGQPIDNPLVLQRMVTKTPVGTESMIGVIRDGKEMDLTVKIGEQPGAVKMARAERDEREHALAGLAVRDLDRHTARRLGIDESAGGVVVIDVLLGSGAHRAGLTRGDVIREINRQPVSSVHDFDEMASELKKDEKALLLIERRGASLFVSVRV